MEALKYVAVGAAVIAVGYVVYRIVDDANSRAIAVTPTGNQGAQGSQGGQGGQSTQGDTNRAGESTATAVSRVLETAFDRIAQGYQTYTREAAALERERLQLQARREDARDAAREAKLRGSQQQGNR